MAFKLARICPYHEMNRGVTDVMRRLLHGFTDNLTANASWYSKTSMSDSFRPALSNNFGVA